MSNDENNEATETRATVCDSGRARLVSLGSRGSVRSHSVGSREENREAVKGLQEGSVPRMDIGYRKGGSRTGSRARRESGSGVGGGSKSTSNSRSSSRDRARSRKSTRRHRTTPDAAPPHTLPTHAVRRRSSSGGGSGKNASKGSKTMGKRGSSRTRSKEKKKFDPSKTFDPNKTVNLCIFKGEWFGYDPLTDPDVPESMKFRFKEDMYDQSSEEEERDKTDLKS